MVNSSSLRSFSILNSPFSIFIPQKKTTRDFLGWFSLFYRAISSHERGQLLNPLQRERRERHRLHGDGHQLHRVIVRGHAVGMQHAAASAAMNHCPLTVFADPDTDGVHDAAAVGGTVARLIVYMQAGQAVRTVIPVVAARACRYDQTAAHPAGEAVVAGMRFVITLLLLLAFILPIHGNSS